MLKLFPVKDRVVRLYLEGKTLAEIGKQFGVSRDPVATILRRLGVPRRKTGTGSGKGICCLVCRKPDRALHVNFRVCQRCWSKKARCSICGGEMPKYNTRGQLRQRCSRTCRATPTQFTCDYCGIRFERKRLYYRMQNKRHYCSNACLRSIGCKDGRTGRKYAEWRKAVFARDKYTCRRCSGVGGQLRAHHIKPWRYYPKLRFVVSNGLTLCRVCHRKEHHGCTN